MTLFNDFKKYVALLFRQVSFYLGLGSIIVIVVDILSPEKIVLYRSQNEAVILMFGFFLWAGFNAWRVASSSKTKPHIVVHYKVVNNIILEFEVHNIGNDYAKDIKLDINPKKFLQLITRNILH